MSSILINNIGYLYTLTNSCPLLDVDIYIEENIITEIGKNLNYSADRIIDGRGKIALPGLINTHHHFFQNVTRNIPIMQKGGLLRWLLFSYGLWNGLDERSIYAAARVSIAELLLTGCTTSMDFMYFFPNNQPLLMDIVFEAASELGIRFHGFRGAMPIMEGNLREQIFKYLGFDASLMVESQKTILDTCDHTFRKYHDTNFGSMQRVGTGFTSIPYGMPDLMNELKALSDANSGLLHTHLHPRPDEINTCMSLYGISPHQWLEKIGWLDNTLSLAHCTRHKKNEIDILSRNNVNVTHSPSCHLRLGYPVAPIPEMQKVGINVSLGVDGGSSNDSGDMLAELRTTMYVHRIEGIHEDYSYQNWMTPIDVFKMATVNGAKTLLRDDIGQIDVGKCADIILYNLDQISYGGAVADPLGALVYCGSNHMVDVSIVNGKVVVYNKEIQFANEEEIINEANLAMNNLLSLVYKKTGINYQNENFDREVKV